MNRAKLVTVLTVWIVSLTPGFARAQWTKETPISAKLVSFDGECALFREESGERVSIRRDALRELKLVAGQTMIQYYRETVRKHLCAEKTPQS